MLRVFTYKLYKHFLYLTSFIKIIIDKHESKQFVGVQVVFFHKDLLIKIPVVPELTRACTENNLDVPVFLREISNYNKVLQKLRVLIVGYKEISSPILGSK